MLNFVTVCTDSYPIEYARKLHTRVSSISKFKFNHYCITDRPDEVAEWATPIEPFVKASGWWNKVNLFSPQMPSGDILYMDLDIVILKNFDVEIEFMRSDSAPISCVSDAITWMGERFSSSLMLIKEYCHTNIFQQFENNFQNLVNRPGGDQVWIGPQLSNVYYIDDDYPNFKKNLKFHLANIEDNKLSLPLHIDENIKLIDCTGRPKPHELIALPYIKHNWHDI